MMEAESGVASPARNSPPQAKRPETPYRPSPSKIPLPKCLEEFPVGFARPRNELRIRDFTGVRKEEVHKEAIEHSQENEPPSEYLNPQFYALPRLSRMREARTAIGPAALTPISVNMLCSVGGQDGVIVAEQFAQSLTTPAVKHLLLKVSNSGQATSTSEKLNNVKLYGAEGVEVEGVEEDPCESQNELQRVVWSNAVFQTEEDFNRDSPRTDSSYNTQSSLLQPSLAALGGPPEVPGISSNTLLQSTIDSGTCHPSLLHDRHGGMSSSSMVLNHLQGILHSSNTMAQMICSNVGSAGVSGDEFVHTPDVSSDVRVGSTMKSNFSSDLDGVNHREASMKLELVDGAMSSQITTEDCTIMRDNSHQSISKNEPVDFASTKKNLFDRSYLNNEASIGCDPAIEVNLTDTVAQKHQAIDPTRLSGSCVEIGDYAGNGDSYIVKNTRDPSKESRLLLALPPDSLIQVTEAIVEAKLEDDIQREIEVEISQEILSLSQKLENLQARYGAKCSVPAGFSCPVTPVLTPRSSTASEEDVYQCGALESAAPVLTPQGCAASDIENQCGASDTGSHHRRRRMMAAKFLRPSCQKKQEQDSPGKKKHRVHESHRGFGGEPTSSHQRARWKLSLGLKLRFLPDVKSSYVDPAPSKSAHPSDDGRSIIQEEKNLNTEESLEGTPSSESFRDNVLDKPSKEPTIQNWHAGMSCPRGHFDNSRRFDWVKSLRSGESSAKSKRKTGISSIQAQNLPSPRQASDRVTEFTSKHLAEGAKGTWRHFQDMDEDLKTRINEIANTATMTGIQSPDMTNSQGTRSTGRVVASRYATSSEPRGVKHLKEADSNILSEDPGHLDSRTAFHLVKAGLTRRSTGKKQILQSPYSKPRVVSSYPKNNVRHMRRKFNANLHGKAVVKQGLPEGQIGIDEPTETQRTWSGAPESFESEYESFTEGPEDEQTFAELINASKTLHNESPHIAVTSAAEHNIRPSTEHSLSGTDLKHDQHPARECPTIGSVELVVDRGYKLARRMPTTSGDQIFLSSSSMNDSVDHCSQCFPAASSKVPEDCIPGHQRSTNTLITNSLSKSHVFQSSIMSQETAVQILVKKGDQPVTTACRLFWKDLPVDSHAPNMSCGTGDQESPIGVEMTVAEDGANKAPLRAEQPLWLAGTESTVTLDLLKCASFASSHQEGSGHPSSVRNFQSQGDLQEPDTELTLAVSFVEEGHLKAEGEANEHVTPSVRARWKELNDALEKERLKLPKIRTDVGTSIFTSPRDSGCVKRIAESVKVIEYFNLENRIPNDPLVRGEHLLTGDKIVVPEFVSSSDKVDVNLTKSLIAKYERQIQASRKETRQEHDVTKRRDLKEHTHSQQRCSELKQESKRLVKSNPAMCVDEIEGLDLESFWCLVGDFEDRLKYPVAAVSWSPMKSTGRLNCEEGA